MSLRSAFLFTWVFGVIVGFVVLIMHLPLVITAVPGGIGDHQAATTGAEITRIQAAWAGAKLQNTAALAMIGDLFFIAIYGLGSILGGVYLFRVGTGLLRYLATAIVLASVIFIISDYTETVTQFMQLMANRGTDQQAQLASMMRPVKLASWLVTFLGMVAAFFIRRKQKSGGQASG